MTEEWYQRRLPRQRPVQPRSLPPLNPTDTRMPMQGDLTGVSPDTAAPPMRPSGALEQGSPMGFPVPEQPPTPIEQMPPRISQDDVDYAQLMSPPKKTNKILDALYVAAQAAGNIFDTEGNYQPIERLGETKKRKKDAQAMQRIQTRNMRQKAEQDAALRDAQIDYAKQRPSIEKDKIDVKYAEIQSRAKRDKERFDSQWKLLEKRQAFEGNQWTREIDGEGYVYKKYKNGRMEPFEINGEQVRDPSKVFYDTVSPITGLPIKVSGAEIFRGESAQLAKNVGIENDDIEDANKRKTDLGEVESKIAGNKARMEVLSRSNATLRSDLANLSPATVYGDKEKAAQIQQQITAQEKEFFDLQGTTKELETQKGKLAQPLQKRKIIGKPVPKSKDPLGIFQ